MAILMLKIRRPNGRLIFNMEIPKRRLDGLYIETGPSLVGEIPDTHLPCILNGLYVEDNLHYRQYKAGTKR